jgi:hypothetical protein
LETPVTHGTGRRHKQKIKTTNKNTKRKTKQKTKQKQNSTQHNTTQKTILVQRRFFQNPSLYPCSVEPR